MGTLGLAAHIYVYKQSQEIKAKNHGKFNKTKSHKKVKLKSHVTIINDVPLVHGVCGCVRRMLMNRNRSSKSV